MGFIRGEKCGLIIADETIQDLQTKGSRCLVGSLGVPKKLNKEAFKAVLVRIWRLGRNLFLKEIQENLWLFEFSEEGDKVKVMDGRPWSYDRTILILNDFDGQTSPSKMDFSISPIWIQIHDMPLGCMNRAVGFQIGSSLGSVEDMAVAKDDVGWGRYLRVRVAINLHQPLERGRSLIILGKSKWVSFKYEKLSVFCFQCDRIIHGSKGCPEENSRQPSHDGGLDGWGSWLRADDQSRRQGLPKGQRTNRPPSPVRPVPGQSGVPSGSLPDKAKQMDAEVEERNPVNPSLPENNGPPKSKRQNLIIDKSEVALEQSSLFPAQPKRELQEQISNPGFLTPSHDRGALISSGALKSTKGKK
ncbi:uncharacterized protein LOC133854564 [Alnus glutinosa]|uniref:uncharacterized protein LOC133854564 n=1 Tax=Alnus glutinosa TaxID=3517 RepID=UPI002D77428A|nr:uncharacterized protein LOC133854564 [Alnus glutinosa]